MKSFFFVVLFITLVSSSLANTVFDVVHYGAVGDGKVDDTQAFLNAFDATCKSSSSSVTMHIPSGKTFLLGPSVFKGQCNSKEVHVTIDGTIVAPTNINKWQQCSGKICKDWMKFSHIDGLIISGSGMINGQGENWWNGHICEIYGCHIKPVAVKVENSYNVSIADISFRNSPNKHIMIHGCNTVQVSNVQIRAPSDSPQTDGIYMSESQNVNIDHVQIRTGDECISIGPNSVQITITNITCGPGGHGISINLGKDGKKATIERVVVDTAFIRGTKNGLAMKTWQGGSGVIRNIRFNDITISGSTNPIIIDQQNIVQTSCGPQTATSGNGVQIRNVDYSNIHGTTSGKTAVSFKCSKAVPCKNIMLTDINLGSTSSNDGKAISVCENARGLSRGQVVPAVECFAHQS